MISTEQKEQQDKRTVKAIANPKQYPRFSYDGLVVIAAKGSVDMYDPDTLYVAFSVDGGSCYCHSLRVEGIDSIENKIKKADLKLLTEQQNAALITRRDLALTYMRGVLKDRDLLIHLGGNDKYGRILSRVFTADGIDLAQDLIKRNLVFPYSGDTKMTIVQQADFCLQSTPSTTV